MLARYSVFDVKFSIPASFLMKRFRRIFKNNAFHVGVRKRSHNLILYQIFDIFPRIIFMNIGMYIVQKLHL